MKHIFPYLGCTLCLFPFSSWVQSSYEANEHITALKARETADKEVRSKYGKADLVAVIGSEFDLGQSVSISYATIKWLFYI